MHYDDVEVPNLIKRDNRYYLIGSIREDIKVHYWYADRFEGPYRNFFDNVLLPQGNYAARVSRDGDKLLVWNFFFKGLSIQGEHLMAPPKELIIGEDGQLHLRSFHAFDALISETLEPPALAPLIPLFNNPHASAEAKSTSCWFGCESGFEAFMLPGEFCDFILSGKMNLEGNGKCGLVFHLNDDGDGYYLSLDLFKGIAQMRAWSHQLDGGIEGAFRYESLQVSHFITTPGPSPFRLVVYDQYFEFSLDGFVHVTLADDKFKSGRVGFYVEGARVQVEDLRLSKCDCRPSEEYPAAMRHFSAKRLE
jgi:beta-fructofuranosidase